jgi:hypothetical protein
MEEKSSLCSLKHWYGDFGSHFMLKMEFSNFQGFMLLSYDDVLDTVLGHPMFGAPVFIYVRYLVAVHSMQDAVTLVITWMKKLKYHSQILTCK